MIGGLAGRMRRLVLSRIRVVMLSVGLLSALLIVASRLIDEGEIVRLTIVDANERSHVTELWIVDLGEETYLRAGSPDAEWLARIRANPEVGLSRGSGEERFRAVPEEDPEIREAVNRAMDEKYGFADRLWAHFSAHERAVPIRLVASPGATTASP